MSSLRLNLAMIGATMVLFVATLAANELLFTRFEYARGINWVYLPAGVRLLCTLLFGEAGAIGLLLVSWLLCFCYFFPDDLIRSFMGGILAAAGPYLVYRIAHTVFGLRASLANLTPKRLLACIVAYAIASPLLHHAWFAVHGDKVDLVPSFLVMAAGDLTGSLMVVYAAKAILALLPRR